MKKLLIVLIGLLFTSCVFNQEVSNNSGNEVDSRKLRCAIRKVFFDQETSRNTKILDSNMS